MEKYHILHNRDFKTKDIWLMEHSTLYPKALFSIIHSILLISLTIPMQLLWKLLWENSTITKKYLSLKKIQNHIGMDSLVKHGQSDMITLKLGFQTYNLWLITSQVVSLVHTRKYTFKHWKTMVKVFFMILSVFNLWKLSPQSHPLLLQ